MTKDITKRTNGPLAGRKCLIYLVNSSSSLRRRRRTAMTLKRRFSALRPGERKSTEKPFDINRIRRKNVSPGRSTETTRNRTGKWFETDGSNSPISGTFPTYHPSRVAIRGRRILFVRTPVVAATESGCLPCSARRCREEDRKCRSATSRIPPRCRH